ncbi:hypothetical protein BU23DRAFT_570123 [Bimuria novae-zelandiae CBS 107.79]|uniref:Uncharacterized protein n=1 Tax=Bimuria novae-zelandiae CBS 107.79 TaxID=1447943 RepID=A0A6A5V1K1_9PLEO|nr:hypothetical protein BU23DRAFT_570123 [Bimuria novae-zelandiae CBS 107.79]
MVFCPSPRSAVGLGVSGLSEGSAGLRDQALSLLLVELILFMEGLFDQRFGLQRLCAIDVIRALCIVGKAAVDASTHGEGPGAAFLLNAAVAVTACCWGKGAVLLDGGLEPSCDLWWKIHVGVTAQADGVLQPGESNAGSWEREDLFLHCERVSRRARRDLLDTYGSRGSCSHRHPLRAGSGLRDWPPVRPTCAREWWGIDRCALAVKNIIKAAVKQLSARVLPPSREPMLPSIQPHRSLFLAEFLPVVTICGHHRPTGVSNRCPVGHQQLSALLGYNRYRCMPVKPTIADFNVKFCASAISPTDPDLVTAKEGIPMGFKEKKLETTINWEIVPHNRVTIITGRGKNVYWKGSNVHRTLITDTTYRNRTALLSKA